MYLAKWKKMSHTWNNVNCTYLDSEKGERFLTEDHRAFEWWGLSREFDLHNIFFSKRNLEGLL